MEVSQSTTLADDHNTNQNEAIITCMPILSPETICQDPAALDKVNNEGAILVVSEQNANHQVGSEGMCNQVDLSNHKMTEVIAVDNAANCCTKAIHALTTTRCEEEVCDAASGETLDSLFVGTGQIVDTPNQNVLNTSDTSRETQNDNSNVDISLNSDDDVKVTCRLSSTPNSYSIHKVINESECSMSSVGEASSISSNDNSKLTPPVHEECQTVDYNNNPLLQNKEQDKLSDNIIYLQPQLYSNKQEDDQRLAIKQEHTPKSNLYCVDRNQGTSTPTFLQQNYTDSSIRFYSGSPYEYNNLLENQFDYNVSDQPLSLTDLKFRSDLQQMNISQQADAFSYPLSTAATPDREYFVYPSIYVSNAGLISVLLRNDMSVEMTVDRTIRVVSHNHMMAVATDCKGTAASLYHPAAKIFQTGYNTDIATDNFRAKITQGEAIFFSNGINCFKLQDAELKPTAPIKFADINRDQSVNLLFSSEGYGESLVATCMQVAAQAEYANLPKGGVIVRINGIKVTQSGCGDVTVVTGAKFIRLSPHNGTTRIGNRFIDIEVEKDWSVKLSRGTHTFFTNKKRTMVSNGKMEAGFDENNCLKVINLQPRHPLITEPLHMTRRQGKRITRTPPPPTVPGFFTPRRRVVTPVNGRGGMNTC